MVIGDQPWINENVDACFNLFEISSRKLSSVGKNNV